MAKIPSKHPLQLSPDKPVRILFVCLGNICRSPAAEGVMQALVEEKGAADRFVIDSAGTAGYHIGEQPDRRMRTHARRRGYDLTHTCRRVSPADFSRFDLIIGMDDANVADLRRLALTTDDEAKVHAMSEWLPEGCRYDYIPDPYYEGAEGFELVLDLLQDATLSLYNDLTADQ